MHYVLSQVLADAVRDNLVAKNPAEGVTLPRTSRKRPVYLDHEQVGALAAASGDYEGLVLLLAYTGLRWGGEAVGLRVHDLDMLRKRASVTENAVQSGTDIYVGTPPKSHKRRTVPLPDFLLPYVARQCEGKKRDGCCGRARTVTTCAARIQRRGGGSPRRSRPRVSPPASRRTICGTPQRLWRCRPGGRTSRRCRGCSDTRRQR